MGGGVALAFIVSLALGMIGLILVYCASAVVVLDRFARVSSRPIWRIVGAAGVLLLGSFIAVQVSRPELAQEPWSAWRAPLLETLLWGALLVSAAIALVWGVLKYVDPA
nr:hypothetical protein [Myxococcota bacterium]